MTRFMIMLLAAGAVATGMSVEACDRYPSYGYNSYNSGYGQGYGYGYNSCGYRRYAQPRYGYARSQRVDIGEPPLGPIEEPPTAVVRRNSPPPKFAKAKPAARKPVSEIDVLPPDDVEGIEIPTPKPVARVKPDVPKPVKSNVPLVRNPLPESVEPRNITAPAAPEPEEPTASVVLQN